MEHDPRIEVTCLDVHAGYACRHAGACCTAGWAIPVEHETLQQLRVHFGETSRNGRHFVTDAPLPEGAAAIVGVRSNNACVFFDADGGRLCAIHRELGPGLLPTACRQFPRVVRCTPWGTSITLSHFCPTAAKLLFTPAALQIVEAPPALAAVGDLEGLDARDALPPLLRPGLLTDDAGYQAWERRAIDVLARPQLTADQAIATIAVATAEVQRWRPGSSTLHDAVERAFDVALVPEASEDLGADVRRVSIALASVPPGLERPSAVDGFELGWKDVARWWGDYQHVARAYLAARLFGNWVAYQGPGLHAIVEYLRTSLSVLKMEAARHQARAMSPWQTVLEAVRATDLLLVHLSDGPSLSRRLV
jgi:Fe-S-cluster containining protein